METALITIFAILVVGIFAIGVVLATDINKIISKKCPEGTESKASWTHLKLKGEL